jgi:hypothetical protein
MRAAIEALDPGVYVYPFTQTHVTLATLVSFKEHLSPSPAEGERIRGLAAPVASVLDRVRPPDFEIDFGSPVLVRAAAFLPARNPTGEIRAVRRGLEDALRGAESELGSLRLPQAVHATILRFRTPPRNPEAFRDAFEAVAAAARFGTVRVPEILITTETRPYMRSGEIVHRTRLSPRG